MNTCKTCKHWDTIEWKTVGKVDGVEVRACNSPTVIVNNGYSDHKTMIPNGVSMFDEGGGTGILETGEDFGCVNHQGKDKS